MQVSRRTPIVATAVDPGKESVGEIRLRLPLTENNQYFPKRSCDSKTPQDISKFLVQVGWTYEEEWVSASPLKIGDKDFLSISGEWFPLQNVEEVEIDAEGVTLCPYEGKFHRPTWEELEGDQ